LGTFFGEADKVKLEDLFKLFSEFMADWKEGEIFLEKVRIQDEKDRKKREEKELKEKLARDKAALMKNKQNSSLPAIKLGKETKEIGRASVVGEGEEDKGEAAPAPDKKAGGAIVDKALGALKKNDANEIMKMVRMRRQQAAASKQHGRGRTPSNASSPPNAAPPPAPEKAPDPSLVKFGAAIKAKGPGRLPATPEQRNV